MPLLPAHVTGLHAARASAPRLPPAGGLGSRAAALALVAALALAACGDDDAPLPPADGGADLGAPDAGGGLDTSRPECENLNPQACLLPWPSSRYLVEDATTRTGYRVRFPEASMPTTRGGERFDARQFDRWDGFGASTSFVTVYPRRIDESNLAPWDHPERSLAADSPTVLLDVDTGERVAHWAEVDHGAGLGADPRTFLYVRPAGRLQEGHHYVLGIRGLRYTDGTPVEPYPPFVALRDRTTTDAAGVLDRAAYFDANVFGPLAEAGVARAALIEAWDMRTASGETAWGDLVHMRDEALAAADAARMGCTITGTDESFGAGSTTFRRIEGTFTVPHFMVENRPGAALRRGADGLPEAMGTIEVPFTANIPRSVAEAVRMGGDPVRLVEYGHGLFGSRGEANGYMTRWAHEHGAVVVATEWMGMAGDDVPTAIEALNGSRTPVSFFDRIKQGMINQLLLVHAFKTGRCGQEPEFEVEGRPTVDPSFIGYHGNSQGGIYGGTIAALSTEVSRWGLGVGAINYGVTMPRSTNWAGYEVPFKTGWRDPAVRAALLMMFCMLWEETEPAAFVGHIVRDPLPGTPAGLQKQVLYQIGRYDAQVQQPGADQAARTMGIPLLVPTVKDVFGVPTVMDRSPSAYVIYDVGGMPFTEDMSYPPGDTSTHGAVRNDPRAMEQLSRFLRPDGVVEDTCGGACRPR
jgi:hypothetical protein